MMIIILLKKITTHDSKLDVNSDFIKTESMT